MTEAGDLGEWDRQKVNLYDFEVSREFAAKWCTGPGDPLLVLPSPWRLTGTGEARPMLIVNER